MGKKNDQSLMQISTKAELVVASGGKNLLDLIRPEWKARGLIVRTKKLLPVDPSSACQRLLNAAIYDLKEKIITAGFDLAKEAADKFKLPSITKEEDITENYATMNIIDLSYRMGILSRVEWRKIRRCYEIRGDLEHEDAEYEAGIDDILYIFKNCIEIILSQDPVELIRVADIRNLVDEPSTPVVTTEILEEYRKAPKTRQYEITEHLINIALNSRKTDIVRQNAMELMSKFKSVTKKQIFVEIGETLQKRYKNRRLELIVAKVAHVSGVFPYLKQKKVFDFFEWIYDRLHKIGYRWNHFESHIQPLEDLEDVGGLNHAPPGPRKKIVLWMILCYLGEPGGYGSWGRKRLVFYSDTAAPRIKNIFKEAGPIIEKDFQEAKEDRRVKVAIKFKPIARRLENLEDLIEPTLNDEP